MPYISPVYKDRKNNEEYNSEYTISKCREEDLKGNIPVMILWNKRHIKFYVSRDASINYILTSFHFNDLKDIYDNEKILYLTHSPEHHQYENGMLIQDYASSFEELFQDRKIMILIMNNQTD